MIVRFAKRNSEIDYIDFVPSLGCKSHLGRKKGRQPVKVGGCESPGNIIHELFHTVGKVATIGIYLKSLLIMNLHTQCVSILRNLFLLLGFFHENTRSDRDKFIDVNFTTIYAYEMSYYHRITNYTARNYFKCNDSKLGIKYGCQTFSPYDLKSISHYPANIPDTNFTVIKVKNSTCKENEDCSFGQRLGLSSNDVLDIASLYKCGE